MTSFTSVIEPFTRIFRVVLPPRGQVKSLPFLKQVPRIMEEQRVMRTRPVRKMAEKKETLVKGHHVKESIVKHKIFHTELH